jgi:hypothetical protein
LAVLINLKSRDWLAVFSVALTLSYKLCYDLG